MRIKGYGLPQMEVYTFDKLSDHIGKSPQAQYLFSYLGELNAKTFFVESDYVDKDFLIDYAKFYARSFQAPRRLTKRIHFFSRDFTTESFKIAVEEYNDNLIKSIRKSYLGFTVVKPIGN